MHVHAPCGLHLVDAATDAAASRAAQVAVGLTLTKGDQQGWRRFFCEEYVASPGWPVPPFGPSAPAAPLPGATGRVHCPASAPTLQIYAYSNRPGPWLCAFLRTAAFAGAPVTVVGWEPQGFVRVRHRLKLSSRHDVLLHLPSHPAPQPDKVWYTIDLVYTWLRYLTVCRATLHPNATLLLADTDQFFVASFNELQHKLEGLFRRTSVRSHAHPPTTHRRPCQCPRLLGHRRGWSSRPRYRVHQEK